MKSPIDFTLLYDKTEGYAVHCSTKEEAEEFVEWARILFPKMCLNWIKGETRYNTYGSETIYTFDSKRNGEWIKKSLLYGSASPSRSMGYKIVEFSDIYSPADDLEESDIPLDMLFG